MNEVDDDEYSISADELDLDLHGLRGRGQLVEAVGRQPRVKAARERKECRATTTRSTCHTTTPTYTTLEIVVLSTVWYGTLMMLMLMLMLMFFHLSTYLGRRYCGFPRGLSSMQIHRHR